MTFNFPSFPTAGQVFRPGNDVPNYVWNGFAWSKRTGTALKYNRVVNSVMQVSQQNVDAASSIAAGLNYYPADQWLVRWSLTGGGTAQTARWTSTESMYRSTPIWAGPSAVQASLGATEHGPIFTQYIEGFRIADLNWGTIAARSIVLRFIAHVSAVSGKYFVRLSNGANNRSYVAEFTLVAGQWQEIVLSIPGDTLGEWLNGSGIGIRLEFTTGIGSTWSSGVLGWQAGDVYATPGGANLMSALGYFFLAAVGLYADPYNTGLAPEFETPHYEDALQDCQRYWYRCLFTRGIIHTTTATFVQGIHPVPMRANPAATIIGAPTISDLSAAPVITSISSNTSDITSIYLYLVAAAGGWTASRPALHNIGHTDNYIAMSARM